MLFNPFTPSEIASDPDDFFGRNEELRLLERSIQQGSVVIQGPVGIGKSSLLSRVRLHMEGFQSDHKSRSLVVVGNRNIETIDQAAHLLLSELIEVDEQHRKIGLKIGPVFEFESSEIIHNFKEGRHLAVLKRLLESDYFDRLTEGADFLILAVDEADKCPVPLARLIRSVSTVTQQQGIKGIRFALAGVTPFFKHVVDEDAGVSRFFYKNINLLPMRPEEADELLHVKLAKVASEAKKLRIEVNVEPELVARIVDLSGGHPHLLQLLGSHLIENEDANPDGIIDKYDLANSLRKICYEDRGSVYESVLHRLEIHGKLDAFKLVISNMAPGFPSRISRSATLDLIATSDAEWLIENSVLSMPTPIEYGLVDEFIRARIILDAAETEADQISEEEYLLETSAGPEDEDWEPSDK